MTTPPPESTAPNVPLGYAAAPSARRRKWLRRALFACALPVIVIVLLRWGFAPLSNKVRFLLQQDRCFRFTAAPDTVAYTEDAATLARLTGGAISGPGWSTLSLQGTPIAYSLAPDALRHVERTPGVDIPQGTGPVFLSGRRAGGGAERLVVVKVDALRTYHHVPWLTKVGDADHLFDTSVMRPASTTARPSVTRTRWKPPVPMPVWGALTLFAGQPVWADASHFTIDYQTPAGRGTIDGWLQSDDTVKFQVRDGPLAQQAPATAPYNPSQ